MSILSHVAMFGWPMVVLLVFVLVNQRHRAVIFAYIAGWMFLPMASYEYTGLPDWDKVTATNLAVMFAVVLTDINRLLRLRPRWYDIAIVIWCLVPLPSAMVNGHGVYEGLSAALETSIFWGIPWVIGRSYFCERRALFDLGMGLLIGAAVYAPLAIFEMRMSPQLHSWIYGFQTRPHLMRYGIFGPLAYRPMLFMDTSFAVSMTFAVATLISFWFWRSGTKRSVYGLPMLWICAGFFGMTVLCKVVSGLLPMLVGLAVLALPRYWSTRLALVGLLVLAPTYMLVRATGDWSGQGAVTIVQSIFGEHRAQSLQTRFENEDRLVARAFERPLLGWGRLGGNWRVRDERGKDITLADGLWVIVLGQWGLIGLVALTSVYLIPLAMFIKRYRVPLWTAPALAPAVPFAVTLGLHMIDNLANAFPNPLFTLAAGGIAAMPTVRQLVYQQQQARARGQQPQPARAVRVSVPSVQPHGPG